MPREPKKPEKPMQPKLKKSWIPLHLFPVGPRRQAVIKLANILRNTRQWRSLDVAISELERKEDELGVDLDELKGKKVVLYFYPKDSTPGCTKEACSFRDNLQPIRSLGAEIIGVSVDSVESHKKFSTKFGLPFPLISDKEKRIAKAYGVLRVTGTTNRVTFIIDKTGIVRFIQKGVPDNELLLGELEKLET